MNPNYVSFLRYVAFASIVLGASHSTVYSQSVSFPGLENMTRHEDPTLGVAIKYPTSWKPEYPIRNEKLFYAGQIRGVEAACLVRASEFEGLEYATPDEFVDSTTEELFRDMTSISVPDVQIHRFDKAYLTGQIARRILYSGTDEGHKTTTVSYQTLRGRQILTVSCLSLTMDFLSVYSDFEAIISSFQAVDRTSQYLHDTKSTHNQGTLTVNTVPTDARVRILNIAPKYHDGISIAIPGKYRIEVSAPGYVTYDEWHTLDSTDEELLVSLTAERSLDVKTPEMVLVKGDCFRFRTSEQLGGSWGGVRVCLDDFYIGKYEVSQEEWRSVMEHNPSRFGEGPGATLGPIFPVDSVSWELIQDYIERLNQRTNSNYRLPTEAEWEFACTSRGKTPDAICFGSSVEGVDFFSIPSEEFQSQPVGRLSVNELGIFDMDSNVLEWTCSLYDQRYIGEETQCARDASGPFAIRGGSEFARFNAVQTYSPSRPGQSDSRFPYVGFRLARDP